MGTAGPGREMASFRPVGGSRWSGPMQPKPAAYGVGCSKVCVGGEIVFEFPCRVEPPRFRHEDFM